MKIVSFEELNEKYTKGFDVCFVENNCGDDVDVVIIDINSIFDYEEKKLLICKENYTSVAIIDDPSDFDAFKNFGITAWIVRESLMELPELLKNIQTRMSL